jgi:hypothetical protein
MNHGCNKSLNVFQPTPPLHYKNGVCQYKRRAASYSYIFGATLSDCDFLAYFQKMKVGLSNQQSVRLSVCAPN